MKKIIFILLVMSELGISAVAGPLRQTIVSIIGEDFYINGQPTYAGRVWNGHRVEGLLLNTRMVQATFDDLNPTTAARWAYPDTGKWDAERNVREFIAALPEMKRHGMLAVTVNFQGGSPEGYSSKQPWETGAFTADGKLRPEFADRMRRVLDAADGQGMVVIVGIFYFGQSPRLAGDEAAIRATDEVTHWLLAGGWRNVLVEICNESNPNYKPPILRPDRVSELIERVRQTKGDDGHTFKPMPVLINEDDHENFDQPTNNFSVAISEHVSWGWFDYRRKGESFEEGYQSPPVNWSISSERKRVFFKLCAEIAGVKSTSMPSSQISVLKDADKQ